MFFLRELSQHNVRGACVKIRTSIPFHLDCLDVRKSFTPRLLDPHLELLLPNRRVTAAAALLDVPVHGAAAADEKVTVGATVFNLSVNSIDVLLKLMVQWKPSTAYIASQGLYPVCGVFSGHVSVQVERRGKSLITLTTGKFCAAVAEGMLLQSSRVLETLPTRFTHALFRVRVRYRVSAQVALGEKGGWAEWAGEPFFIAFHAWVLELFVQSQVVLLSTGKATVLAYVRFLPTVSSTVYQKPRFLTKDLSTGGTGKSLDVCQVLVFVSQLV